MVDDSTALPRLRQELQLESSPGSDGEMSWRIYDPWQHRFFQLSDSDVMLISRPGCRTIGQLKPLLDSRGRRFDIEQFGSLTLFLRQQHLLMAQDYATSAEEKPKALLLRKPSVRQLPLWDPMPLLHLVAGDHLRWLVRILLTLWLVVTLVGGYMTARQWDSYLATFRDFYSLQGVLGFGVAILFLKWFHEMGHAFVAYRQGCRVGKMGISLFVIFPMFYTDLTDAARIVQPRRRMWIALGGVGAETLIAGLATAGWALLPPGSLRSICFVLATTSWVTTLAINLNPFSRFDGYYFLNDLTGVDNLQPRSRSLLNYYWHRWVLGPVLDKPEPVGGLRPKLMALYGLMVLAYQMFLILGIGYLAYLFFIPLIGILIFAYILYHYLLQPLLLMGRDMIRHREKITWRRKLVLTLLPFVAMAAFFYPLPHTVTIPVMVNIQGQTLIYTPEKAQLETVAVSNGDRVRQGQVLLRFSSPELTFQREQAMMEHDLMQFRLNRISSSEAEKLETVTLRQKLQEAEETLAGLDNQLAQLVWRSPVEGMVVDLIANLQPGQWFSPDQVIGRILEGDKQDIIGYVDETFVSRLLPDQKGKFIPNNLSAPSLPVKVEQLDPNSSEFITPKSLSVLYGGPIASLKNEKGDAVPVVAMHRIQFLFSDARLPEQQALQGVVVLRLAPESLASQSGKRLWRLIIAELNR